MILNINDEQLTRQESKPHPKDNKIIAQKIPVICPGLRIDCIMMLLRTRRAASAGLGLSRHFENTDKNKNIERKRKETHITLGL